MRSSSTAKFRKQRTCPPAKLLLRYAAANSALGSSRKIKAHLAVCDFCGAELQMLTRHPPVGERTFARIEIPVALRCLAESLMAEPSYVAARFAEATFEKEPLSLTDA